MAEELAKTRLSLKSLKLVNCQKVVKQSLDQAYDTSPTEKVLTRQVTHVKEAWEEYEEAMLRLQESAAEGNLVAYKQDFERDHSEYDVICQRAEEFLERFNQPEEEEEPDYKSVAATNARERAALIQDLEDELVDAEADLEKAPTAALWTHVESLLRANEEKLTCILIYTQEAGRLVLAEDDAVHQEYHRLKRDTFARALKARSRMTSTPLLANTSSTNFGSSENSAGRQDSSFAMSYFQRQPFPKFSRENRDYLCFRKEWRETVTPSHDETFQLWEIRRAVPAKLQPDLKNLRTMNKVWATLDEEFGQLMDNVSGLIRGSSTHGSNLYEAIKNENIEVFKAGVKSRVALF